ncbi:MAG: hypothetical protein FVQ84_21060 [Planctomycetes bacterium]|nr:hypothetical protein [Planctomycetota bacterium]
MKKIDKSEILVILIYIEENNMSRLQFLNFVKALSSLTSLKISITAISILLIIIRLIWPNINIDSITLGLLVVAVLPWLSPLIKSVELPGGTKVEIRNLKDASDKIVGDTPIPSEQLTPEASYLEIADIDPNLALVGLRIEIERRLRTLGSQFNFPINKPLRQIILDLRSDNVITHDVANGLVVLTRAGNSAAHGAWVEKDVADWAIDSGRKILAYLDQLLKDNK